MSEGEFFTCSVCSGAFRRAEHLRRHVASHSSSRPFQCYVCGACFKRRDVLRKHLKGCPERIARDLAMPEYLSVGKKATSCDQCARSKKACDRSAPCATCVTRQKNCTYARQLESSNKLQQETPISPEEQEAESDLNYDFADDEDLTGALSLATDPNANWVDWNLDANIFSEQLGSFSPLKQSVDGDLQANVSFDLFQLTKDPGIRQGNTTSTNSFDFLLNFTQSSGVRKVFNYKRQRHVQKTCKVSQELSKAPDASRNASQPGLLGSLLYNPSSPDSEMHVHRDKGQAKVSLASLIEYLDDPLFAKTKAIWDSFRVSRIRSSQNIILSNKDAEDADERCLQFFCPPNLRKFLKLFWDEWYPHCPIIHKPTFNALQAPAILLIPMAIMGALMSPTAQDATHAREWITFGEESVFSCPIFSAEAVERGARDNDTPLRIIQAAYITCIFLNWEGTDNMKQRVRHRHFAAVVSVVREIGLSSANHFPVDCVEASEFDWHAFIQREETIRTFIYVFLLDTAFVIFNNAPPRMVLREMDLEMTVPEACFQKFDAMDCYTHWHAYVSNQFTTAPLKPLVLAEAIGILMRDNFDDYSLSFVNRSTLNLFTLVAGLHTVVFQQRSLSIYFPTDPVPIRNAMSRWQSSWKMRADTIDNTTERQTWQDIGFSGQAQEFAWLILAQLDALNSSTQLASNSVLGQTSITPVSDGRLDDTSMSSVTDLMLRLTLSRE